MVSSFPSGSGRCLVTGAGGFVGRAVVSTLKAGGYDPVALLRPGESRGFDPSIETRSADLLDLDSLREVFLGIDQVVHLAARSGGIGTQVTSSPRLFYDNLSMTRNALEAAAASSVRRIFLASSAVVYRADQDSPLLEDASLQVAAEAAPYAWSKVCDEVLAAWYQSDNSLETVVGRFTNVYGPLDPAVPARSTVVYDLFERAKHARGGGELSVWGNGTAIRSFMYVSDVAGAVATVLAHGAPGQIYNIDSGEAISVGDLAARIRDIVDPSISISFDPSQPTGVPVRVLDPAKLRRLGFESQVDLETGLRATAASLGL